MQRIILTLPEFTVQYCNTKARRCSMNLLYTQFIRFKKARKYKRAKLRAEMAPLKEQMTVAYNQIRLEQKVTPVCTGFCVEPKPQSPVKVHAGPNQDYCRIVQCYDDSFIPVIPTETCDYFSFDTPCSYECDCCNQAKNRKYFELKAKYDQLCAKHTRLSWKNQLISLIRGKGFSL